jgi:hypothetical protein
MRNFREDPAPQPGWSVDWKIDDLFHYLPTGSAPHLRYTGLSQGASASTAEAWISPVGYNEVDEAWIPAIMMRRKSASAPLSSTFAGIIEPYDGTPILSRIERLPVSAPAGTPDDNVCALVTLADGRTDLIISTSGGTATVEQGGISVKTDAELSLVRRSLAGDVVRVAIAHGSALTNGGLAIKLHQTTNYIEIAFSPEGAHVVSGDRREIESITKDGHGITVR